MACSCIYLLQMNFSEKQYNMACNHMEAALKNMSCLLQFCFKHGTFIMLFRITASQLEVH